ncbi:hypothetical protein AURDEDRAFT_159558 [Auricularia subglabra TFB-10046 SS5]|nr:hypothetical protein AURDEDRAFT_159558 [Auricularia subglabra TFB-10046 SS5]
MPDGLRRYSAPPIPIRRNASVRLETPAVQPRPKIPPRKDPVGKPHSPPHESPENMQPTVPVPAHVHGQTKPGKPINERKDEASVDLPSTPAASVRKKGSRIETTAAAAAAAAAKSTPSLADLSQTAATANASQNTPPKPPAGPTLYTQGGKRRFSDEAKHAKHAGLDMCSHKSFVNYYKYNKDHKMAKIETEVLGEPYGGDDGEPTPKQRERPESEDEAPPRKKHKHEHKDGHREPTRIKLTEEEERQMAYRMEYETEDGGMLSKVWGMMRRKFPDRGFTDEQWEDAYRQNMLRIDRRVAAAKLSVKVESEDE